VSGWVRRPAVAGSFYPSDPAALRTMVAGHLDAAGPPDWCGAAGTPKALIAPHAGYRYSGPIAATAYRSFAGAVGTVRRVVVAGPSHFVPLDGVAVSSADAFATPLGPVTVDEAARDRATAVAGVIVDDRAHADEHSLEVHLPFLAAVVGDVPVLPLLVGRGGPAVLADVLDALWGGDETRIVVSTDLSHYHDDFTAKAIDRETAALIVDRDVRLAPERACGASAVTGLLEAARRHDLTVRLLDLRTSADTAGDPSRVVGYGAFALT
jgi:AmmeMemoRadiSam system protein B